MCQDHKTVDHVDKTDFLINSKRWDILTCISHPRLKVVVDGKKVDRETFFNTLNEWGKDKDKRFIVLHRSILSEGISVNGLEVSSSSITWILSR